MSSLWKKVKKSLKKVGKKIKKSFTDPGSMVKDALYDLAGASVGLPGGSFIKKGLDNIDSKTFAKEFYRGLEGYIPGTDINPVDRYLGKDIARENFKYQQDAYEYQKWLNAQQMEREDTAYQRKLNDITGAGFNPILAAGGSGSASSPLRAGVAPQMDDTSGALRDAVGSIFQMISFKKDLAMKDANIHLMKSQASKAAADAYRSQVEAAGQEIQNKYLDDYYSGRNEGIELKNKAQALGNSYAERLNEAKLAESASKLRQMDAEINKSDALTDLLKQQKVNEVYKQTLLGLQQSMLGAKLSAQQLDTMAKAYSFQWYVKNDLPYGNSNQNAIILSALNKVMSFLGSGGAAKFYGLDQDRPGTPGTSLDLRNLDPNNLPGFDQSIFGKLFDLLFSSTNVDE